MKVVNITPVDISGLRDEGMQAAVLLAASLGWNVTQRINSPVVLRAKDGTLKNIPTNTSIRFGVYQSTIRGIITHRDEDKEPTALLVSAIAKAVKLGINHQREILRHLDDTETVEAIKDTPVPMPEFRDAGVKIVKREPSLGHGAWATKKHTKQYSWESDYTDVLTWSDGSTSYECRFCGRAFTSPTLAGQHGGREHRDELDIPPLFQGMPSTFERKRAMGQVFVLDHTTGERTPVPAAMPVRKPPPPPPERNKVGGGAIPAPVVALASDEEVDAFLDDVREATKDVVIDRNEIASEVVEQVVPTTYSDADKLALIAAIAGGDMTAENARLKARVAELESNLRALKELIGAL